MAVKFIQKAARSLGQRGFSSNAVLHAARQTPHGGKLMDNMVKTEAEKADLIKQCEGRVKQLTDRQSCDAELIMNGGFSPLSGFMNPDVYDAVVKDMRTPEGLIFGLPVVLDSDGSEEVGQKILLKQGDHPVAVMEVESKWKPNKPFECKMAYSFTSIEHPGVRMVAMERGEYYIGGKIYGLNLPQRVFPCQTPAEVREMLPSTDVVAFQCRNPIHRAHYELFIRSLDSDNVSKDAHVLVHPTCGPTQEDDIPGVVRYNTYEVLKAEVDNPRVKWAYLPYSMHMAGPREAIQHMMIRKNYGCTHFIIGRDMAGCKSSIDGEDFYGVYDAQEFAKANSKELGVDTVPSLDLVYTQEKGYITAASSKQQGLKPLKLSGTEFRRRLRAGENIPEWFAFKSVVEVLRSANR
jgi:sulfate adenylyltransferase|mmetsp:Transcript_81434/g.136305  ORF Transcript_81434/g.136305 Transcript_81434/m.136305 type:complete len:407 (-) Transcript_81434:448-1668(-)|eukprot:CAMPEP_0174284716 /NCGR_PEP_ID=MMETSP0809-20121228/6340_1 /TAXON_ID=73025 ORGANISM="Eutreptiella gymnastica-like, Strain CCMP1594" /NCGR_SAMPLE_ID=MMETSP0809 /ASSEMBLY_ACC=CAM_ASM_000658 /LENGTH=406 /DNA_ID=CAMNT_0015380321 /DNA_START=23 /DNA_END=1243 /DNA_ORIENTATION=+